MKKTLLALGISSLLAGCADTDTAELAVAADSKTYAMENPWSGSPGDINPVTFQRLLQRHPSLINRDNCDNGSASFALSPWEQYEMSLIPDGARLYETNTALGTGKRLSAEGSGVKEVFDYICQTVR